MGVRVKNLDPRGGAAQSVTPMPDEIDIKRILRTAALTARKSVTETELNEAVVEIVKKAAINTQDLRSIGQKVANDAEIFAVADPDDVNDVLARLRNK